MLAVKTARAMIRVASASNLESAVFANKVFNDSLKFFHTLGASGGNLRRRFALADFVKRFNYCAQEPQLILVSPEGFEPPITVPKTVVISVSPRRHIRLRPARRSFSVGGRLVLYPLSYRRILALII